ncbi:MAG: tRNA uridine-5-carboxymethylaminomethyl(34) synthesis GTPase MnmE [Rickettsiales bacterium]
MSEIKTIFGVATAIGKSGVAVIRISGNACLKALAEFGVENPKPREAMLCKLRYKGEVVDSALVLYFKAPHSFTGEDVAELHTHGSKAVIRRASEILSSMPNVRMALPGEFSRRAFENGKMDLTEAEGIADLIDAETTAQAKQAIRQMQGELGKIYNNWRDEMVDLLARVEAYIDFPDEDLPQSLKDQINSKIINLKSSIINHLNDNRRGERIREGIYVVILGAPNVGKSSLLNFLAGKEAAIVSATAGTTRDVIEVNMEIAGLPVTFADTAGLRDTKDEIESEGIKRALDRARDADLKILMIDANDTAPDLSLADDDTIIVVNKVDDKKSPISNPHSPISIKTGEGVDDFLKILSEKITTKYGLTESPVITRARHREALNKALEALNQFSMDKPIELVGEDLRYTAREIGRITGKIDVEDILDKLFSSFCIGK